MILEYGPTIQIASRKILRKSKNILKYRNSKGKGALDVYDNFFLKCCCCINPESLRYKNKINLKQNILRKIQKRSHSDKTNEYSISEKINRVPVVCGWLCRVTN